MPLVASEGTNLMKKVHPDEHIVPSLEIDLELDALNLLQNAVAFEFTSAPDHAAMNIFLATQYHYPPSSLREDGAVLLNALKMTQTIRLRLTSS
ncbi:hypothetical protein Bca52824_088757 [Brassica carinata]|uniref:Uncharacterized protein n=1 Tax=Brassica carinata TaxID=52824 RepID=A0A8X7PGD1_BRACI|nr:hypothetical protein Bca52824_088757 [Brassica carinata]